MNEINFIHGDHAVLSIFKKILGIFMGLWAKLSDDHKDKIIDVIVESFDLILRTYFREIGKEKGEKNG